MKPVFRVVAHQSNEVELARLFDELPPSPQHQVKIIAASSTFQERRAARDRRVRSARYMIRQEVLPLAFGIDATKKIRN